MHIPTLVTVTRDSCFAEKKFSGGKSSFCIPQRRHDRLVLCSRGDRIFLVVESACSDTSIVLNGIRDASSVGFMRLHCGQDAVVQSS